MLLAGFDHLAVLTADTARFHTFYTEVFGAEVVRDDRLDGGGRLSFVRLGKDTEFNVFELPDNDEASRESPMFARGRLDHFGLLASSMDAFRVIRERLVERGASDGFVTDFGPVLSVFFRDPDGLEGEVCVGSPDAAAGVFHPPGTPSKHFPHPVA
jgi:catechol 2,3-dioxygenase-like lactoylglutathione lyase family enzyme